MQSLWVLPGASKTGYVLLPWRAGLPLPILTISPVLSRAAEGVPMAEERKQLRSQDMAKGSLSRQCRGGWGVVGEGGQGQAKGFADWAQGWELGGVE